MTEERRELHALVGALGSELRRRTRRGTRHVPRAQGPAPGLAPAAPERAAPDASAAAPPAAPLEPRAPVDPLAPMVPGAETPESIRARAAACSDLASLREAVSRCTACPLHATRTQTVFADGADRARVMFVGEAPGYHEDQEGVPFVGAAGKLLTDIITKGMGLERRQVSIANVLKCRPPDNRDPAPGEKALCTPWLDRQIELVDPEVLIPLGLHASQHLLGSRESMGRLRRGVQRRGARRVVPTYHPAYLLRSPQRKPDCWQDIQVAMGELGLQPPAAQRRAAEPPPPEGG